jgi:hypothetical protein
MKGGKLATGSSAVFEALEFFASLDDVAVVGEAIKQCDGHFGIVEHARPFAKCEVGDEYHGSAFIKTADQVEQQLPARANSRFRS